MLHIVHQFFRVLDHGPELVHRESSAVQAAAALPEDNRTGRRKPDQECDQQEDRGEQNQRTSRNHDVEEALQQEPEIIKRCCGEREQGSTPDAIERDLAVYVWKEVDCYTRSNPFLIASQEDFLETREFAAINVEDDLIDNLACQQFRHSGGAFFLREPGRDL